jgi:alcohol dehydrogenase class IV
MMPAVALADPELTYGLPPHLTAATGMDALAHLLEAWFAPFDHPYADGIALEGIRYIHQHLARAVADGSDRVARAYMLAASQLGGAAFQKGLGAIHALSHPIGALYDTHHGLTNAVVMPYVLAFNRRFIEDRATWLARHLDLARPGFDALLAWILDLRAQIGIPPNLSTLGVQPLDVPRLAAMALQDPTAAGNPRPLDVALLERLFARCLAGRLEGLAD